MSNYRTLEIMAPFVLTLPQIPDASGSMLKGASNALWPLVTTLNTAMPKKQRYRVDDMYCWNGDLPLDMINWEVIELICEKGPKKVNGEVKGWEAYLKIDDPDSEIPEGVKNRIDSTTDPETEATTETVKNWRQWLRPNSYATERDGGWYLPTWGSDGVALDGTVLLMLSQVEGIEVIPFAELPKAKEDE